MLGWWIALYLYLGGVIVSWMLLRAAQNDGVHITSHNKWFVLLTWPVVLVALTLHARYEANFGDRER